MNRHYADWLGLTLDQLIGRPFREVIGDQAFEETRPYWERALAGERVEYEKKIPYKGRPGRWIHAIYTPTSGSRHVT